MAVLKGVTFLPSNEITKVQQNEVVLKENSDRWVMFPIEHDNFWVMYKELESNFWAAEDFIYSEDNITDVSSEVVDTINNLASYHIMMDHDKVCRPATLTLDLLSQSQLAEARAYYGFQLTDENIHSETVELMLLSTKTKLNRDSGRDKIEWLKDKVAGTECFIGKVLLSVISKLLFSSALSIFKDYLNHSKILPTYASALNSILTDRLSHARFSYSLSLLMEYRLVKEEVHSLLNEAKELEIQFATTVLPLDSMNLTQGDIEYFVEHVVNQILAIGCYDPLYKPEFDVKWLNYYEIDRTFTQANARPNIHETVEQYTTGIKFDEDF